MAEAAWMQKLSYRMVSAVSHQPRLLRLLASGLRNSGKRLSRVRMVANVEAVREVLAGETSFSRAHLAPVLIDGEFLIGQPGGTAHSHKRACLHGLLPAPEKVAETTSQVARELHCCLTKRLDRGGNFDLIEDYMAPLVWQAIRPAYGSQAFEGPLDRELLLAARWVGAQLMIGSVAPPNVRQRALRSAAVMDAAFDRQKGKFDPAWDRCGTGALERRRDAIGLMWVGHPATIQAGALIVQELLGRRKDYDRLRLLVRAAGGVDQIATAHLRDQLRDEVLELLRFRPPFPLLARRVLRETTLVRDSKGSVAVVGPGSLVALTIGALFDPAAQHEDPEEYLPGRHFHSHDDRYLMFGSGPRHCFAREQVIEMLVSALGGLLALDGGQRRLRTPGGQRARTYDGPVIVAMPLRI